MKFELEALFLNFFFEWMGLYIFLQSGFLMCSAEQRGHCQHSTKAAAAVSVDQNWIFMTSSNNSTLFLVIVDDDD